MKRIVVPVVITVVAVGCYVYVSSPSGPGSVRANLRASLGLAEGGDDSPSARAVASPASPEQQRIRDLENELREKDKLVSALLVSSALAAAPQPVTIAELRAKNVEQATRVLDQRLFADAQDEAQTAELERSMEEAIGQLPEGVETEVACGANLCRVSVQSAPDVIGDALTQLGGGLPKTFGATKTMSVSEGHRLLYVARDPRQLDLDPEQVGRLMAAPQAFAAKEAVTAGASDQAQLVAK